MKKPKQFKPKKSLQKIADESDLSVSYLSRVFRGSRIPRVHMFKRIADSLGMSMDLLYSKLKGYYK